MTGGPTYCLEDVTQMHGGRMVLDLPRFDVAAGEVLCLVGPPGAGKSTLLRLLAGLETSTSGNVWFGEYRFGVRNVPAAVMRSVTQVFQRPLLLAGTVRANVEYGQKLRGARNRAAKAAALLNQVHLTHLADRQQLLERNLPDLIIDRSVIESMFHARNTRRVQIVNGLKPELLGRALAGEPVGTVIDAPKEDSADVS